jgi:hypothetical protein
MKVTKQEAQDTKARSHSHVAGKKFKNVSSRKADLNTEVALNGEAVSASPHHQQNGTKLSKMKHVDVVNIIPPVSQQDSINFSSETPVLLSGDGILRQVFTFFVLSVRINCSLQLFIMNLEITQYLHAFTSIGSTHISVRCEVLTVVEISVLIL